jgi:ribosomal-protein-alanine N-acetyltransferase
MQITTDRLILREYTLDDVRAVLAYQRQESHLRYYPWTRRTRGDVRDFVKMLISWRKEEPRRRFQFAVTLADSGELIGSVGIRRKPDNDHEADIGYEIAEEYQGHGYATEATAAVIDFGFRELKLHRISASLVADNVPSAGVLERLGMKLEGRLRESEYFKGRWWDGHIYAILEDEWRIAGNQQTL